MNFTNFHIVATQKTMLQVLIISTSVKSSQKHLPGKKNFSTFLLINCSNFRLEQCERP